MMASQTLVMTFPTVLKPTLHALGISERSMPVVRYQGIRPNLRPTCKAFLQLVSFVWSLGVRRRTSQIMEEVWVHPSEPIEAFPVIILQLSHEVVMVALLLSQQTDMEHQLMQLKLIAVDIPPNSTESVVHDISMIYPQ